MQVPLYVGESDGSVCESVQDSGAKETEAGSSTGRTGFSHGCVEGETRQVGRCRGQGKLHQVFDQNANDIHF